MDLEVLSEPFLTPQLGSTKNTGYGFVPVIKVFALEVVPLGLLSFIKKNSSSSLGVMSAGSGMPVSVINFLFSPALKKNVPDPDK